MAAIMPLLLPAGIIFLILVLIVMLLGGEGPSSKRMKAAAGADAGGGKRLSRADGATANRRKQVQDNLKNLSADQRASRRRLATTGARLGQAGLSIGPLTFWIGSLAFGGVLTILVFISGFEVTLIPFSRYLIVAGVAVIGMFGLPRWIVDNLISGRQKKFTAQFTDALEVMVRGIRSGLILGECLQIVARESQEPLRSEFLGLTDNMSMGATVDTAIGRLYTRMPLPEVNFFQIVLAIQARGGGNLTEALANLAGVLRARRLMKEKIKALSSEAIASASIIGCLPPGVMILVYMSTPKYITLLFTTALGNLYLVIGAVTMSCGIFVMKKMVSFKF
jgi:tight adherence protein B